MKKLALIIVTVLAIGGFWMQQKSGRSDKMLRVAFGGPWKTIHPGLQHTLVGDLVLSNQFESLVGTNEFGVSVPLGAKSWEVSEDYKTFTFHIETERMFSDGKRLSARDFKQSWEAALALAPKSNNSSLLDVMYKIRGFKDFENTKTLSGIEAIDDTILKIHFDTPFRMALAHLQGNRFSAYQERDGKFIGTGKYVIDEAPSQNLHLTPNPIDPDASALSPIELSVVPTGQAVDRLLDGTIDVFAYGRGSAVPLDIKDKKSLSVITGQDALHETLILNLMPGRLFQNRNYRLAMQHLIHEGLRKNPKFMGNPDYSAVDGQVFMPVQTGRMAAEEADEIIDEGKKFVPELVAATKEKPILVFLSEGDDWLIPFLKEQGLAVAPTSMRISAQDRITMIYKTHEPDVIVAAFGVASGDPDGVYHRLGKSGAIMTPMSYSEKVADLLEEGRKLLKQEELDSFYQEVSRAILKEVPFVHMGYSKAVAIYRNDVVAYNSKLLRRNEGHIHGFRLK